MTTVASGSEGGVHAQLSFKLQFLPLLVANPDPNLMQLHDLIGDHHKDQGEAAQEPRQQRHVLQAKVDLAVPVRPQLQVHCCLDHLPQEDHRHRHGPPEVCQGALSPQGLGAMHMGDRNEDCVQDDQGGRELLSRQQPIGKIIKPGRSCVSIAGQHDGGAVGEVAGSGAVTEALQREAKADEARADGEAEFEQEAEEEVVLGLLRNGLKVLSCGHRHDGTVGRLPQQRDAEQRVAKAGQPQDVGGAQQRWQLNQAREELDDHESQLALQQEEEALANAVGGVPSLLNEPDDAYGLLLAKGQGAGQAVELP